MTSDAPPAAQAPEDPRVTIVVVSRDRREELLATLGRHRAPVARRVAVALRADA